MELREHQKEAKRLIVESFRQGRKRPIVAAPTAFGKTILAGSLMKGCQDKGNRGIFICDRVQLIEQTIEKFTAFGIDFGVRQANHELHNPAAQIQIASVQTLAAMVSKHKRGLPEFDFAVIDECHSQYDIIKHIIETYNNIPIIGLSATPYSKGLGKLYNNLLVPITPRELLSDGYLTPIKYYGGVHVDRSELGSVDPNTFRPADLEAATERDSDRLTGDIIKNWIKWGENFQTIAFSPSQNHSKYLVERFRSEGISAEHIDCYTPPEERQELIDAHNAGEFYILSCSRLLNTGYDAPTVRCLIDCFPTKSLTTYVQRLGRITRTADGKDYSIYLDHAGNFDSFGYAEDIVPESLCMGKKTKAERELTREKKEPKTSDCPQCHQRMVGMRCMACGYQIPMRAPLEDDGTMLKEIVGGTEANRKQTREQKAEFLAQALGYAITKGYKPGWAAMQYQDKYGVFPDMKVEALAPGKAITSWVQYKAIVRSKSKKSPYREKLTMGV
jgi:DNA repair protein RadD